MRPAPGDYPPFAAGYVARVPDGDIIDTLSRQISETLALLQPVPESQGEHRYADGKWSIRQVVGHLADAERVFAYRALRFSRGDTTPVEGFDENLYVSNAPFARAKLSDLVNELEHLRRASIHLFANLDAEAMDRRGIANGFPVSVRALAFMIAGHESHHFETLRTKYLARPNE